MGVQKSPDSVKAGLPWESSSDGWDFGAWMAVLARHDAPATKSRVCVSASIC